MTIADAVIEALAAGEAEANERIQELEAENVELLAELLVTRSERDVWREMAQEALGMTARNTAHLEIARHQIRHARAQAA